MDKLSYEMIEDNSVLTMILRAVRAFTNHQIIKEGLGEFRPKAQGFVYTSFCIYKSLACCLLSMYSNIYKNALIFMAL